jgi:predicted O-methyltransferase YrrM
MVLLQAIILYTNPKKVLEIGHFWGKSAQAMLDAMSDEAELVSYDNTKEGSVTDKRFTFKKKCQTEIDEERDLDFVFLDASHELGLNQETFKKLYERINPQGIIAVHDTGLWTSNVYNSPHGKQVEGGYAHCPDEREFVNWVQENYDVSLIHIHNTQDNRHGITLIQKKEVL